MELHRTRINSFENLELPGVIYHRQFVSNGGMAIARLDHERGDWLAVEMDVRERGVVPFRKQSLATRSARGIGDRVEVRCQM